MKIIPLSEGTYTVGHDKIFMPFDMQHDILEERPTGSLLVEIQPFLIVLDDDLILCDTGLGIKTKNNKSYIIDLLAQHGYSPNDITKVLLSHLHKDHMGGTIFTNAQGEWQLAFPNSMHYIYQSETEYALSKNSSSYPTKEIEFLLSHAPIEYVIGKEGFITPSIHFQHSGGHSPFHIVFTFSENGSIIFYGGDEAPQYKQMKVRFMAKYDADGKKAMLLREEYGLKAKEQHWKMLFYHDISNGIVQF